MLFLGVLKTPKTGCMLLLLFGWLSLRKNAMLHLMDPSTQVDRWLLASKC